MQTSYVNFHKNIAVALEDQQLQKALSNTKQKFVGHRADAIEAFDKTEFESLRDFGQQIRDYGIAHMPELLQQFSDNAEKIGTTVLWASDAKKANLLILEIAQRHNVKNVVKSKSMASEEVFLNDALEAANIDVTETDLGEYIIQIAKEKPSHIIAPAMHKSRESIAKLFEPIGCTIDDDATQLTRAARRHLRKKFLAADMGISGANFLLADTGSSVIVTNEGNGRMTTTLPAVHVTLACIDKILPSISNLAPMLTLLTHSATGQKISNYVSITSGNNNDNQHRYVILLDNGRSALRHNEYKEMLRCIRCGACLNHCPVYQSIGGQSYGMVYMGPMGQVISGTLLGVDNTPDLPHAATLCNACDVVCPVKIPLPTLIRRLRDEQVKLKLDSFWQRTAITLWSFTARHPRAYRLLTSLALWSIKKCAPSSGVICSLPIFKNWFRHRDFKFSHGPTFSRLWQSIK